VILQVEHHGSDSDGDAFRGGEGADGAYNNYSTGRAMSSFALSLRTIKLRPFNICYASTDVTRFSSPKQDLVKALSSKQPLDRGRVEACELNHYALESARRGAGREVEWQVRSTAIHTNTRKNRHEIGAGVYYTHGKHT
jgi:hypothetical protein